MDNRQIVSTQTMRQLDKLTLEKESITSYNLMKRAGDNIFNALLSRTLVSSSDKVLILSGMGNNGGDGLVVAKLLKAANIPIECCLVGDLDKQSSQNKQAHHDLAELTNNITVIKNGKNLDVLRDKIDYSTVIIDCLFGIGLNSKVRGIYQEVIKIANQGNGKLISIDLPSGLNADNGVCMGDCITADYTFAIQNLKQGHFLNDGPDYCGIVHVLDIGILQQIFPESQIILDPALINHNVLPKRQSNTHKYHYGNILIIGGSKGMMGAPLLSGISSLRTGTGLSTVTYHYKDIKHIHNPYPELMVNTYDGINELPRQIKHKDVVIFGGGLKKEDQINKEILKYLLDQDMPLVIDATGIVLLRELIKENNQRKNIIITPHYGEMAQFLSSTSEEVKNNPVLTAQNIAHKYNLTVVLKSNCTLITDNDETFFNAETNPGLATAGSGDVLSGIIGSLLGQGYTALESAKLGVLIHSKAGRISTDKYGEHALIASDIIEALPDVLKQTSK